MLYSAKHLKNNVYSTLLGKPKWRAYDYSATLEWSVTNLIDLIAATVLSYTNQSESYNTFEVRPIVGTMILLRRSGTN